MLSYMRSVDAGGSRRFHDSLHRIAGCPAFLCDVPLAEAEMLQPEDFAVFGHETSFWKAHGVNAVDFCIIEISMISVGWLSSIGRMAF